VPGLQQPELRPRASRAEQVEVDASAPSKWDVSPWKLLVALVIVGLPLVVCFVLKPFGCSHIIQPTSAPSRSQFRGNTDRELARCTHYVAQTRQYLCAYYNAGLHAGKIYRVGTSEELKEQNIAGLPSGTTTKQSFDAAISAYANALGARPLKCREGPGTISEFDISVAAVRGENFLEWTAHHNRKVVGQKQEYDTERPIEFGNVCYDEASKNLVIAFFLQGKMGPLPSLGTPIIRARQLVIEGGVAREQPPAEPTATKQPEPSPPEDSTGNNDALRPAVATRTTALQARSVYIVQPGDYLGKIARCFGTTDDKLAALNKISDKHVIFPDQQLVLTVDSSLIRNGQCIEGFRPGSKSPYMSYILKLGDTLTSLSDQCHITIKKLKAINKRRQSKLIANRRLLLPSECKIGGH
jgi:LysM repeat protein